MTAIKQPALRLNDDNNAFPVRLTYLTGSRPVVGNKILNSPAALFQSE